MQTLYEQPIKDLKPFGQQAQNQWYKDQKIRSLDPLGADEILRQIPIWNAEANLAALISSCRSLLPEFNTASTFDYYQAAAAMRDLGILLGSIRRHGEEPVAAIPELEEILLLFSEKTSLPPRDTLLHYTNWNPEGERRRSYTGNSQEKHLIESINIASLPLMEAILMLRALLDAPIDAYDFAANCTQISNHFQATVQGMVHAKKKVSTEFFGNELRPYYEAIQIGNQRYVGPGGGELPVFVFDHLLWSSRVTDVEYVRFKENMLPYILPELRQIFLEQQGKPSLIDKLCDWAENEAVKTDSNKKIMKAANQLFTLLKSFRMPHLKMANEAYVQGDHSHKHGSGGYTPNTLTLIIQLMLKQFDRKDRAFEKL
jgi:monodechloroaminopyrrolnitrin synthase